MTEPSFFILGNPRSGTTLFRLMLTCHPEIVVPPEAGFAVWLSETFGNWVKDDCFGPRLNLFLEALKNSRKFEMWNLSDPIIRAAILRTQPSDYQHLISAVYLTYAESVSSHRTVLVGDKNNFYTQHVSKVVSLFPDSSIIHVVRDGRDVAASYLEVVKGAYESAYAPRLPDKVTDIAVEWSTTVLEIENIVANCQVRSLTIQYERLVQEPKTTLSQVCSFLGVEFDPMMLEFDSQNRRHHLEPAATLEWKAKTLNPLSQESIGRYRSELSADEITSFNTLATTALHRFGYTTHTEG